MGSMAVLRLQTPIVLDAVHRKARTRSNISPCRCARRYSKAGFPPVPWHSLGFSTRRSAERCPTSVFLGSSCLVPLPYIQDLNVLLCYPFSKFLCWTPSRCSPSCAPTLRRPPPAFDPHPASSLPPRRTNPLENRRVTKMHRLHVLAAALPGTGAGFRDCRAPEAPPTFH